MNDLNNVMDFIQHNCINCIYGLPATGKTTLCLVVASSNKNKKVAFIDTENSFSVERLRQINGNVSNNLVLFKVRSFKEQAKIIENLLNLKSVLGTIIVDSLTFYYRKELQAKRDVNNKFSRQLSMLAELARQGISVVVTSQVYQSFENEIKPVGNNMLKNWAGTLIKLEKLYNIRKLILEKHPKLGELEKKFEIVGEGLKFV